MSNDYRNFFEQQRQYYDKLDNEQKSDMPKKPHMPAQKQNAPTAPTSEPSISEGKLFEETKDYKQSAQTFKNLADYYSKNGEDKLISDIFANVKAQKAAGKLTNEQIMQFAKSVSPMLNKQQKEKLGGLLKQLLES